MGPCFDCSGLTQGAFRDAGTWIPRDAYQQRAFATPVTDVRDAMPGDLLFFGDSDAADGVRRVLSHTDPHTTASAW